MAVEQTDCNFLIEKERLDELFNILRQEDLQDKTPHKLNLENRENLNLQELLDIFSGYWKVSWWNDENPQCVWMVKLSVPRSMKEDFPDYDYSEWLYTIAPVVKAGSYIELKLSGGERYRLVFTGKRMVKIKMIWPKVELE